MKKNKNIYIIGSSCGDNSWGVGKTYLEFAAKYGNPKILMPYQTLPPNDCDLLILPGGADLSSESYGQNPGYMNSNPDSFKQHFYNNGLKNFIEKGISILGICLGHQMLASYFNIGQYKQNLQWHPSSDSRYEKGHDVIVFNNKFYPGKPTKGKNDKEAALKFAVNSHHHQGVLIPVELAYAEETVTEIGDFMLDSVYYNGPETVIESMYHKSLQIVGVQFHIEEPISYEMEIYGRNVMNYLLTKKEALASVA